MKNKIYDKPSKLKQFFLKNKKPDINKRYIVYQTGWREFTVGETVRLEADLLAHRVSVDAYSANLGFQYAGMIKDSDLCDLLYVNGPMYGIIEAVSKTSDVAQIGRITR